MDLQRDNVNILYVFGGEKASGAEIVIERLMSKSGFNSHLFIAPGSFAQTLLDSKKPYQITVADNLKKLNRSNASSWSFYLSAIKNYFSVSYQVYKYIRRHKINVVHANVIAPAAYMLPLVFFRWALCRKVKFVWSDHDLTYFSPLENKFANLCAKKYDITFVVSNAVKKRYNHGKVVVLYNGLDITLFKLNEIAGKTLRQQNNIASDTFLIGLAGVIAPRKGQLALIQAYQQVKDKHPEKKIKLILAGRFGDDDILYNDKVASFINNDDVIFLSHVSDMVAFYNACDIIVNNSNISGSEPLGTTIYEAMACETLVLASNTGGNPEIIDDTINGYLFEPENQIDLIDKLSFVLNNKSNLGHLQKAARAKVKRQFDIEVMAENYRQYLEKINLSNT